jgi:hypothetical protein
MVFKVSIPAVLHIQLHTFVPAVRVTRVLPTLRFVKELGAFTSYQSFLEKGSTLQKDTDKTISNQLREFRK